MSEEKAIMSKEKAIMSEEKTIMSEEKAITLKEKIMLAKKAVDVTAEKYIRGQEKIIAFKKKILSSGDLINAEVSEKEAIALEKEAIALEEEVNSWNEKLIALEEEVNSWNEKLIALRKEYALSREEILLPNFKMRKVNSWNQLPTGFSPDRKLRRTGSYEQLATAADEFDLELSKTSQPQQKEEKEMDDYQIHPVGPAEHETDLGLPPSIQPQQKEEEDDYEVESFKRVFRSVHASSHADVIYKPSRKELDPNSPDFDQKVNKLIENVINPCQDSSEDSDTDSDDEVIKVPKKRHWMDICLGIWGLKDDDAIISQVKASKQVYEIYTDGLYNDDRDSGCGAILHDCNGRPIVARSKVIPKENCVSPFYLQLEGVALGIKLAKKYNSFPFYLYCQSFSVCEFFMQNWKRKDMCICSGNWETVTIRCKACSKRFMFTQDQKDHEQAFELTKDIFSDISILESRGLGWFVVCTRDWERNEAAYYVATLQQNKELKLREIVDSPELWDILYTQVFGHYFE